MVDERIVEICQSVLLKYNGIELTDAIAQEILAELRMSLDSADRHVPNLFLVRNIETKQVFVANTKDAGLFGEIDQWEILAWSVEQ